MKYLLCCWYVLSSIGLVAQWADLAGGYSYGQSNWALYDSIDNRVYLCGNMRYMAQNTAEVRGVAYWQDGLWHRMNYGSVYPSPGVGPAVQAMCRLDTTMVVAGQIRGMDSIPNTRGVAQWHSGSWHSMGIDSASFISPNASRLQVINDTLHMLGGFVFVYDGDTIRNWAVWNGNTWAPGDTNVIFNYFTRAVCWYQSDFYMAGNFNVLGGVKDIARRNGGAWQSLGTGIMGDPWVNDMVVYDGLLWVVGEFYRSAGNPGSGIMVWDGTQWLDPFPMLDMFAQGRDLEIIDGRLYFTGAMNVDGMADYYGVGRYDGEELCIIGGPEVFALNLTGNADTLYMATCGTHTCYPDGLPVNGIAKWPMDAPPDICFDVEVGVAEGLNIMYQPSLHPNPFSTTALLTLAPDQSRPTTLAWYDATGRLVRTDAPHWQGNAVLIERGALPPGLYFLRSGPGQVLRVLVQ
jgi:hypothetical protein